MTTSPHKEVQTVEPGWLIEFRTCKRCDGRGYHHGFGEHGHDPDWCSRCGGPGYDTADLLTGYET
jgi:hypothetical protein